MRDLAWKLTAPIWKLAFKISDFIVILLIIALWYGGNLLAKILGVDLEE